MNGFGMEAALDFIWTTDLGSDTVGQYFENGTFVTAHSVIDQPTGITHNDGFFYLISESGNNVHVYYDNNFSITGESFSTFGDLRGIGNNGTFLWSSQPDSNNITEHEFDGTYTGNFIDSDLSVANTDPRGITVIGNILYSSNPSTDRSYAYYLNNKTYAEALFPRLANNSDGFDIGYSTNSNKLWVYDQADQEVYRYEGIFINPPPTSTLNQPADAVTVFNPIVLFNATGSDDTTLQNMSLYVNESLISTNSSPINNTLTSFPHTLVSVGLWNWTVGSCDNLGFCFNATHRDITFQNDITVALNQPATGFNSTIDTIIFNATGSDDTTLQNMSFILNATYNGTNTSVFNNTLTQFPRTLADGFYNWTVEACDNNGLCINATARNFTIDTTLPLVNITFTLNISAINFHNSSINQTINWTSTDNNIDSF